ncbi:MAG: glycosyltransferase family 2 protein [Thalassovita sp.]
MISIIIPANNEEALLPRCLSALAASDVVAEGVEVIVAANACTDGTVAAAELWAQSFVNRGWSMHVLDLAEGGKMNAMNQGDAKARGDKRVYLDADVVVDPVLLSELSDMLSGSQPIYASGDVRIAQPQSWVSRAYREIYMRVPFFTQDVPGCGLFAVNAPGRARWAAFPDIISDDTFVRLCFPPSERKKTKAGYDWPIVEGFGNLVKVRRRQNIGVDQVAQMYPELQANDTKPQMGMRRMLGLAFSHPLGFCVYGAVAIVVKMTQAQADAAWSRGR